MAILVGTLAIGGSAGAAWLINAHRANAVEQELDGMMQKLSTDDRVRYFGDNIISWGIDHQDEVLRVGMLNPTAITVEAKKWLGPRAVYYRTTAVEPFGFEALRTSRLSAEVKLGCALSAFISTSGNFGNSREDALRAITWSQSGASEPVDYELWTHGPLLPVYTEPAPSMYLAFTSSDHVGLGVALLYASGTRYTVSTWACSSDPRVSVIAGAASSNDTGVNLPGLVWICTSLTYDIPVPDALKTVLRDWGGKHGFAVKSAMMSGALPLPVYAQGRECIVINDGVASQWHVTQAPRTSTEVRSVLADIRYPGADGDQPSPGSPYFLVASVNGAWTVVKSAGMPDEWAG